MWLRITVAGLIGIGLGALFTAQQTHLAQQASSRSRVTGLATVVDVAPTYTTQGPAMGFSMVVNNLGPQPLTLVVSPRGATLDAHAAVYELTAGQERVAAGDYSRVIARVLLDCDADSAVRLAIPVRSPDGTRQQLQVQMASAFNATLSQAGLCQLSGDYRPLVARIGGTVAAAVLDLKNTTNQPLTVSIDTAPGEATPRRIRLTTVPALPITVPAHTARQSPIRLDLPGCSPSSQLQAYSGFELLAVHGLTPAGEDVGATELDISPLLGSALGGACH